MGLNTPAFVIRIEVVLRCRLSASELAAWASATAYRNNLLKFDISIAHTVESTSVLVDSYSL